MAALPPNLVTKPRKGSFGARKGGLRILEAWKGVLMSQVKCAKAGKGDTRRAGGREEVWTQTGISKPIGDKTVICRAVPNIAAF